MEEKFCKDCKHFCQHYRLDETGFVRVYCGHCMRIRPMSKKPHQKICGNFEQGNNPEEGFADKQYLTKALLDWIQRLDLLPKIKEEPENSTK